MSKVRARPVMSSRLRNARGSRPVPVTGSATVPSGAQRRSSFALNICKCQAERITNIERIPTFPSVSKRARRRPMATTTLSLPHLRFEITEAAKILRISRATLYERISSGLISVHKDGRRTFITTSELERYVNSLSVRQRDRDAEVFSEPNPQFEAGQHPPVRRSTVNRG
jgi:excisionase family DNA binding protein